MNPEYYLYAAGMTTSQFVEVDGITYLYPEYDIYHMELVGKNKEKMFNVIAKINK
jgi:hypothetical protein